LKGHVNSSGFPLQIGLENLVNGTTTEHGWRTLYEEHSWQHPQSGDAGFIDLVLANRYGTVFFAVECKRVKDTSWIFLSASKEVKDRRHTKAFVFSKSRGEVKRFEWIDLTLDPATPEAQFCVIPGSDQRSKSLIERSAAELVYATESLALEDKELSVDVENELRVYFNLIVTTATLQICSFEPHDVSIKDGTVEDPEFLEVPYVRFRKQLSPTYNLSEAVDVFGQSRSRAKENTVFVVNSEHLVEFLREFELEDSRMNEKHFS
jgi:hypothetical protein|tara:strand:- start:33 stop:824 length:792 start_codon:yes stop_codon:yes gene_type:complete